MYQEDPTSKIFAPLAEAYRKIGLVDEAIEICKEGLVVNPDFIGGKVALARAYAEKKMHSAVRDLLMPIIDQVPDNLIAQKLLADASLMNGYVRDALNSYKMYLYFNPQDRDIAGLVQELEIQSYKNGGLLKAGKPEKIKKLLRLQKLLNQVQQARGITPVLSLHP